MQRGQTVGTVILTASLLLLVVSSRVNGNADENVATVNVNGSASTNANANVNGNDSVNAFYVNTANTNASGESVTLNVNGSSYNTANANAFNVNTANTNASGKSVTLNVHVKSSANTNASEAQVFLEAHNFVRRQNNQPPLTWDDKLARHSESWASTQAAGDCKMIHSDKTKRNFSESLFWGTQTHWTAEDAVKAWADEAQFYDLKALKCKENETCGHFTQMVWRNTTRLGCSRKVCTNNSAVFVVCNYEPKGNYMNVNPFTGLIKPNTTTSTTPPPPTSPSTPLPSPPPPSSSQSRDQERTISNEQGVIFTTYSEAWLPPSPPYEPSSSNSPSSSQSREQVRTISNEQGVIFTTYSEAWLPPSPPHQPSPSNSPSGPTPLSPNSKTPLHTLRQKVGHNGPGPGHHRSHGGRGFGSSRQRQRQRQRQPQPSLQPPPSQPKEI